ncbi:MAG: hypothetical protein BAA03_06350 [Caldibacillus debilis]|nr:MAG: hypothetical protein BAA03_06350 [Caldibacillus debilis]
MPGNGEKFPGPGKEMSKIYDKIYIILFGEVLRRCGDGMTENRIELLKQKIRDAFHHSYLSEQIGSIPLDDRKILFLSSLMDKTGLSGEEKEKYIVASMLVQIALDAHEHVSGDSRNPLAKWQQLTVLAGDFYSGLFYQMLSRIPNIPLINAMAQCVKSVNEAKVSIYSRNISGVEDFFKKMEFVETALFQRLARFFGLEEWRELARTWLFFNKLQKERDLFSRFLRHSVKPSRGGTDHQEEKENERIIDGYIRKYKAGLETAVKNMSGLDERMRSEIISQLHVQV